MNVSVPENSPEAKKRKREKEDLEVQEILADLSDDVSSDENNNSSEQLFDPKAAADTDCDSDTDDNKCDCNCQCCGRKKSKVNSRNTKDLTIVYAAAIACGASNYQKYE